MNKKKLQFDFRILDDIARYQVTVIGNPKIIDSPLGKAIEFDGQNDGILIDINPVKGLQQFTIEVVFKPYSSNFIEQRFLHMGECHGDRLLFELRLNNEGKWYLDTFIASGKSSRALMSRDFYHALDEWYVAALVFNGHEMKSYVNGSRELVGRVNYKPMDSGRFSIGVRQNLVSWFKGALRQIKITPDVLTAEDLLLYKDRKQC
jgi:hypothetical protein